MQRPFLSCVSVYAVLSSVMSLSNATKNQRDFFSSLVQNYVSLTLE